jgi:two-component system LytT family response regulator
MPNESGFTLLNKIEDIAFEIIFVTAHDEYALKAFEFSATGYILKPIDNMMLKQALNTAIDRIKLKDQYRSITSLKNYINNKMEFAKLAIPMEFGFEFVYTHEVIRLESEDGYTNVILDNKKKILSSKGLAYFKKIIPTTTFVQIHRSYIVNLDYVEKYLKSGNVVMKDASIIPVSRNSKDEFLALFM